MLGTVYAVSKHFVDQGMNLIVSRDQLFCNRGFQRKVWLHSWIIRVQEAHDQQVSFSQHKLKLSSQTRRSRKGIVNSEEDCTLLPRLAPQF